METQENNNTSEPHIKIFNQEYDKTASKDKKWDKKNWCGGDDAGKSCDGYHHRKQHGSILGPMILFGGVMLLIVNMRLAPKEVWHYVWPFWPALLILAGIRIIFGINRGMALLISLLATAVFYCVMIYALIQVGSPLVSHLYVPQGVMNWIANFNGMYK